jgi:hypothetical protein
MKVFLISICFLFSSYGCDDTPTASTKPQLDTTTKESTGSWSIRGYDENQKKWIATADKLSMSRTWRFISYLELDDGSVRIQSGYTLDVSNPSDNDVEVFFSKLTFADKNGIPLCKDVVLNIDGNVRADSTATYSGLFKITVDNIDVANQITQESLWANATRTRTP